jgi:hypothetical protein
MKSAYLKSIRRLLFAHDHYNFNELSSIDDEGVSTTTNRLTLVVTEVVERAIRDGMRVAFLADSSQEKSAESDSFTLLHAELELIHLPSAHSCALAKACRGFAEDPAEVLLIAADRKLRAAALEVGMQAVPHPAMVKGLITHQKLYFARLEGQKSEIEQLPDVVPYYIERQDDGACQLFCSLSLRTITAAVERDIELQIYPVDIASQDVLFIRVDKPTKGDLLSALKNRTILSHEQGRILIALSADENIDELSLHGNHGHHWQLMPSPELLQPAQTETDKSGFALDSEQTALLRSLRKLDLIEQVGPVKKVVGDLKLLFPCCPTTAQSYQNIVDRYSGVTPLDSAGLIQSREVSHADNQRVVHALLKELRAMGYCAWTHSFNVEGDTAKNVIAELPGRGYLQLNPAIWEKIRRIFACHCHANPLSSWLIPLEKILGREWSAQLCASAKRPWQLRQLAERQLGIYHYPILCYPQAGFGARLVIVGSHLDSTASFSSPYDPVNDAAPGADDNASGIAGTLAAAKFMMRYRNRLRHSVRFCFFNAEEQGMVGSQAYATYLKSINAKVKAAVCMDMIGFNSDSNRLFEIHAGYTDPHIRDLSLPIANQVASSAAQLGSLAPAQIYQGTIGSANPNRNTHDGAINRSDHASFHLQGYPAVVVSEDFFINQSGEPPADANPNYHRSSDTVIDSSYGADIACAIAHAVKELAE